MSSEASEQRPGFSDLLAELTDSDVVIEVVSGGGARRPPEIAQAQRFREAIESSYRALAGPGTLIVADSTRRRST